MYTMLKKSLLLISLFTISLQAQIVLQSTYNYSGTYTHLANSGRKFFVMDVAASQCRIYNLDNTLWKTISLQVPANHYLYDIKFVTEGLFTTDNILSLAYTYYNYNEAGQYYTYTSRIIRENGTELLNLPGCQYLIVHSMPDGSTRLLTYHYDYSLWPYTIQTKIYSLPGQLITGTDDNAVDLPHLKTGNIFPNPAAGFEAVVPYHLPEGLHSAVIKLFSMDGKVAGEFSVSGNSGRAKIPVSMLPSGTYVYHFEAGNYRSAPGKLIVQ